VLAVHEGEAEAVLSLAYSFLECYSIAHRAIMVHDHVRIEETVTADLGVAPDDTVGTDSGAIADDRAPLDYGIGIDPDPFPE